MLLATTKSRKGIFTMIKQRHLFWHCLFLKIRDVIAQSKTLFTVQEVEEVQDYYILYTNLEEVAPFVLALDYRIALAFVLFPHESKDGQGQEEQEKASTRRGRR